MKILTFNTLFVHSIRYANRDKKSVFIRLTIPGNNQVEYESQRRAARQLGRCYH